MRLYFALNNCTDPYINLSTEWSLLEHNSEDSVVLFLWQNESTIVIGANQNPYLECNIEKINEGGAKIARRRTGGGAVYHDLGNINFSFIADEKNYDVNKQLSVIQKALLSYGIESEISGRNDITTLGRKFSGNAFYNTKSNCLHHGTILIKTNAVKMKNFLCPSKEKLLSKGVKSVESRIINLSDIAPELTATNIIEPLKDAFESIYGQKSEILNMSGHLEEIALLAKKWSSNEYIFDKWKNFFSVIKGNFSWGLVDIQLNIEGGIISEVIIASDSLYPKSITLTEKLLKGKSLSDIKRLETEDKIAQDIIILLRG